MHFSSSKEQEQEHTNRAPCRSHATRMHTSKSKRWIITFRIPNGLRFHKRKNNQNEMWKKKRRKWKRNPTVQRGFEIILIRHWHVSARMCSEMLRQFIICCWKLFQHSRRACSNSTADDKETTLQCVGLLWACTDGNAHGLECAWLWACITASMHLGPPTEARHSFTTPTFTATLYFYCKRTKARPRAEASTPTQAQQLLHHIRDILLNQIHLSPSSQPERRQVKPGCPTLPPCPSSSVSFGIRPLLHGGLATSGI